MKKKLLEEKKISDGKWISFHNGKVLKTGDSYNDVADPFRYHIQFNLKNIKRSVGDQEVLDVLGLTKCLVPKCFHSSESQQQINFQKLQLP
eukprot:gene2561-3523_t